MVHSNRQRPYPQTLDESGKAFQGQRLLIVVKCFITISPEHAKELTNLQIHQGPYSQTFYECLFANILDKGPY